MDAFPDLPSLSDDELKGLIEHKVADEQAVSERRRELHAELDLLRGERLARLKQQFGEGHEAAS